MNFYRLAMMLGAQRWVPLVLIGLGLLLLIAGLYPLLRNGGLFKPLPPPRRLLTCLAATALGIGLPSLGGWVMFQRPESRPGSLLVFRDLDDENDPEALKLLKEATFARPGKTQTRGDDWPQWRGPNRDGVSPERGLRTDWSASPLPVAWKRPLGGGYSSPVVADGRLFVMDRQGSLERVVCLDASSGQERWVFGYPVDYEAMQFSAGPRSTPAVADGRVYTLGATGVLLCLAADSPEGHPVVQWRHDLPKEYKAPVPQWGMACSPLVDGAFVYVQPGGPDNTLAAFDRRTGRLAWHALGDPTGYSSPVAATVAEVRQIVCCTSRATAGVSAADGRQLWYYRWPTAFDANIATPVVVGDYVFIASAYGSGCVLLELRPDGAGGTRARQVYIKRRLMRNHHATAVPYEGCMYGFDTGGSVSTGPNVLQCVDLRTGQERWSTREVTKGSLILADGHLLILSQDGTLSAVAATPTRFRRTGAMPGVLKGEDCWSLPALASGRLYLRDHQEVVCLELKR